MRISHIRQVIRLALFGAAAATLSSGAMAQSVTSDVTASATLVRTLAIASTTGLSFGHLAPGATAGTVVIAPDGARSATGGVTLIAANAGAAGAVTMNGSLSMSYTVSMPATVNLTAAGGGGQTMALSSLTTNLTGGTGALSSSGTGSFSIGGTLAVGANQTVAVYNGVVPVTVSWN